MYKKLIAVTASLTLLLCLAVSVQADKKEKKDALAGAKCPVSGKPINKEAFTDYKGGKIYFCCPGCPTGFAKNTAKFAAKANAQLAQTGQAKQVKCPVTGKNINPKQSASVASVEVNFCCGGCKKKVSTAEGDAQLNLVFSDSAFKKGYTVGKEKEKD